MATISQNYTLWLNELEGKEKLFFRFFSLFRLFSLRSSCCRLGVWDELDWEKLLWQQNEEKFLEREGKNEVE